MKPILAFLANCLLAQVCFSQPVPTLPPRSKIIFFGDSQTSYGFGVKDNSVQFQNHGYVAWVNALSPGIQITANGIQAMPGETTVQMMGRLQAVRSSDAKVLVVLAGTNDVLLAVNPETTKANLRSMINAGKEAGMRVILLTILPQFNPPAYHDIVEDFRNNVNGWIRAQTDVTIVDAESDLKTSNWYEDGRHLTPAGALVLGRKVSEVINRWVPACLPGSGTAAEWSVAANANPFLAGSRGTTPGASGAVADHWQLSGSQAGGALVVGSKETVGNAEQQVITVSGLYTGAARRVSFLNDAATPIALAAGNMAEGVAEVEIPLAPIGIKAIYLKVTANNSDYSTILAEGVSMFNTSTLPMVIPAGYYLLRTPAMTVGHGGAVAFLTTQIVIEFENTTAAAAVSALLKIRSVGIRRLPLAEGPVATIAPATAPTVCPTNPVVLQATAGAGYSWQWTANGADMPAQNASTLSVTLPGTYGVKTTANGCTVKSAPVVITAGNCTADAAITTGSLPAVLCAGQSQPLSFTTTGNFASANVFSVQLSNAQGSFSQPVVIGSGAGTSGGTLPAQLPANLPAGNGYRVRVVSSHPAVAGTASPAIRVPAVPVLTSSLTPPAVCNNSSFSYTPEASVAGSVFQWSRAAATGISNAAATGSGSIAEVLRNTTTAPLAVTYTYTLSAEGCSNGQAYMVAVVVQPSPVAKAKNIRAVLDAGGKATIEAQQINDGSQGHCSNLQYRLSQTAFTCADLGARQVTLQVTDAAGNQSSASATVTVADESAPVIGNLQASPSTIVLADGKMTNVNLSYTVTDNCRPLQAVSVKSSEPPSGLFAGDQSPDWQVVDSKTVQLRAERGSNGRTYTITVRAFDAAGNTVEKDVTVTVPAYGSLSIAGAEPGLRLLAYPNPFQRQLTLLIRSSSPQPVNLRILDVAGRVLQKRLHLPPTGSLVVDDLKKPGIYFLEAFQGNQKQLLRLLKLPE